MTTPVTSQEVDDALATLIIACDFITNETVRETTVPAFSTIRRALAEAKKARDRKRK